MNDVQLSLNMFQSLVVYQSPPPPPPPQNNNNNKTTTTKNNNKHCRCWLVDQWVWSPHCFMYPPPPSLFWPVLGIPDCINILSTLVTPWPSLQAHTPPPPPFFPTDPTSLPSPPLPTPMSMASRGIFFWFAEV